MTADRSAPSAAASIVILGASGDLARRKLVPALFELHRQGQLAPETAVVGFSRSVDGDEAWRADLKAALASFGGGGPDEEEWRGFAARLAHVRGGAGVHADHGAPWHVDGRDQLLLERAGGVHTQPDGEQAEQQDHGAVSQAELG